jgi:hypothetical protein
MPADTTPQPMQSVDPTGPDGWISWHAQRSGMQPAGAIEYAYYTDAHLLEDRIDLGPCRLLNTFGFAARQPGQVPLSLVLRVELFEAINVGTRSPEQTDAAAWHGGGLDEELAALVSLALGIRLRSGGQIRIFDPGSDADVRGRPVNYDHVQPYLPQSRRAAVLPAVTGPVRLSEAAARLARYPDLAAAEANALVKAARSWQEAVWVADSDPRQAWLRLITALESAAQVWAGAPASSPEERLILARPKLANRLVRDATPELHRFVAKDLDGVFKATEKFVRFAMAYLPDPPAERPPVGFQLDWTRMEEHLALVYDWRSQDLHAGTPIPAPMCEPPQQFDVHAAASEIPLGLASWTRNAAWLATDTPMLLHTFADISRRTLLNWLATTAAVSSAPSRLVGVLPLILAGFRGVLVGGSSS